MFRTDWAPVLTFALVCFPSACKTTPSPEPSASAAQPIPSAKPVERGAVGDNDLRVMLTELASAKACELAANFGRCAPRTTTKW